MRVKPADRDGKWIKDSIRDAIKLEFSTIPPYLCGMWSVKNGPGNAVYDIINTVVLEEMTHMGLACNILTALGEAPVLNTVGSVPHYPHTLPASVNPGLVVSLVGLSLDVVKNTFMAIETPEFPPVVITLAEDSWPTIGAFYTAISEALRRVNPTITPNRRQRKAAEIGVTGINSVDDAVNAIEKVIKMQGEGTPTSPFDGNAGDELAHYYQFWQVAEQKVIKVVNGKAQWGEANSLPFPETYPMAVVPDDGWPDPPQPADPLDKPSEFDKRYQTMLDHLNAAWATDDDVQGNKELGMAQDAMLDLGDSATHLMTKPLPSSLGSGNYGPCFRVTKRG